MKIGYCRVSSNDQTLNLQKDALKKAGCEKIFSDTVSGAKESRPGLDKCLDQLREGDTLIVWRLDRLGRSLKHLLTLVENFSTRGIGFVSLTEAIDTTSSGGRLVFSIFGAIAEFERQIIRERTNAGLTAARSRGKKGGRREQHSDKKILTAIKLADDSPDTIEEICRSLGISKATYYRRRMNLK
ncbi:recombinase family protein [Coleofasciculus sp. FACHB-64]|uniref:recombinase family protein n=1 Tax=Cyanophyceae TaxID=3028117 RepID=UPI001685716D|nr:recombinase family protein [Coleofasciculus sp. FACHB-64]MBD2044088.1 recombinase family protein [Coleofasciculus sp. FACHB-64]